MCYLLFEPVRWQSLSHRDLAINNVKLPVIFRADSFNHRFTRSIPITTGIHHRNIGIRNIDDCCRSRGITRGDRGIPAGIPIGKVISRVCNSHDRVRDIRPIGLCNIHVLRTLYPYPVPAMCTVVPNHNSGSCKHSGRELQKQSTSNSHRGSAFKNVFHVDHQLSSQTAKLIT